MVGENQYRCSRCDKLNDADRCQSITELPEVVHFSLLRFTFNPKTGERKKSKAAIIYPKQTIFGGVKYDLRAVVSHIGSSVSCF
jgi:ubiquitin carboxyl-terminal hydrolase 48